MGMEGEAEKTTCCSLRKGRVASSSCPPLGKRLPVFAFFPLLFLGQRGDSTLPSFLHRDVFFQEQSSELEGGHPKRYVPIPALQGTVTLFGKMLFAEAMKVRTSRSSWVIQVARPPTTGVLMGTQRRGHMKTEAGMEGCGHSQGILWPPEYRRGEGWHLPQCRRGTGGGGEEWGARPSRNLDPGLLVSKAMRIGSCWCEPRISWPFVTAATGDQYTLLQELGLRYLVLHSSPALAFSSGQEAAQSSLIFYL